MAGTDGQIHEALLRGWLRDVDPDAKTALLHDFAGNAITLRFSRGLGAAMYRLAARHVEVRGSGRFNGNDEWEAVEVASIVATGSPRDALPVAGGVPAERARALRWSKVGERTRAPEAEMTTEPAPPPMNEDDDGEMAFSDWNDWRDRIIELREGGRALNAESKRDFWKFMRPSALLGEPAISLLESGNLRVDWEREDGIRLHVEFLGGEMAAFAIEARRRGAAGVSRVSGTDTIGGVMRQTHVFELVANYRVAGEFDLEAILHPRAPKSLDHDNVVTASEPFDVDEFLNTIYEGRNVNSRTPTE